MSSETGRAKIIVKHDLSGVYITSKLSLNHPALLKPQLDRSFQESMGFCDAEQHKILEIATLVINATWRMQDVFLKENKDI